MEDIFVEAQEAAMLLKRLEDPNEEMWKEAFALCESAFPKEERRDLDELLRVMKNSDYHFCVLLEREELCGIVLYWEIGELIYLEHLATMPEKRCSGLGSAALELLKQEGKMIILEIEPPADELTKRRLGFYQRNGFEVAAYRHVQAKYHEGDPDVELVILSYPEVISREAYDGFYSYLQRYVGYGGGDKI